MKKSVFRARYAEAAAKTVEAPKPIKSTKEAKPLVKKGKK